jgi:hypothetical protein
MGSSPVTLNASGQPQTLGANGQPLPVIGSSSTSSNTPDYSQLLPSASQLASYTPLSYQSFGSVPQVQAATATPASVDLSQMPGALSQFEQMNQTALAPTFQQQSDALTANEADRGIFNSTAGLQLGNNLAGQQAGALASADAPLVSSFAGYYNQGEETNAANQQGAALANQTALNNANDFNATSYGDVTNENMQDYNQYLNELGQYQTNLQTGLAGDVIQSYGPQQYESLLNTGLQQSGSAYTGAYNNGAAGTAGLSNSLGNLASSLFTPKAATGVADPGFGNSDPNVEPSYSGPTSP